MPSAAAPGGLVRPTELVEAARAAGAPPTVDPTEPPGAAPGTGPGVAMPGAAMLGAVPGVVAVP